MAFIEYPKIEAPFKRDPDNAKHVMYGVFRSPEAELLKDLAWEWSEKCDGTNIQIRYDGHRVSFGGRTERAQIPSQLINFLQDKFGGEVNEEMFEQKFGDSEVILYGEGYGAKIQKGGGDYRPDQSFVLFDVMIDGVWLNRESVEDIAKYFDIEVVPVILTGTVGEAIEYIKKHPDSHIAGWRGLKHEMEGLVGRAPLGLLDRRGRRIMMKVKWNDFKEFADGMGD